jgi:RimJ/RimL family protein N-acetyltransferase
MAVVRKFQDQDWNETWEIVRPVFRAGETYAFSPDITADDAYKVWIVAPSETFVAVDPNNTILGTYYIKPNQPALGAHVCNCGYIVSENARNMGLAALMCDHSQVQAVAMGFLAMQYNLVVATNESAVHLWKKKGFEIIGTLPKSFRHSRFGLVDAYIMYKLLK